jgi:hypothetical protein
MQGKLPAFGLARCPKEGALAVFTAVNAHHNSTRGNGRFHSVAFGLCSMALRVFAVLVHGACLLALLADVAAILPEPAPTTCFSRACRELRSPMLTILVCKGRIKPEEAYVETRPGRGNPPNRGGKNAAADMPMPGLSTTRFLL